MYNPRQVAHKSHVGIYSIETHSPVPLSGPNCTQIPKFGMESTCFQWKPGCIVSSGKHSVQLINATESESGTGALCFTDTQFSPPTLIN